MKSKSDRTAEPETPAPSPDAIREGNILAARSARGRGDFSGQIRNTRKALHIARAMMTPMLSESFFKAVSEQDGPAADRALRKLLELGATPSSIKPPKGHVGAVPFALSTAGMPGLSFLIETAPELVVQIPPPEDFDKNAEWLKTLPPETFHSLHEAVASEKSRFPVLFSNQNIWERFGPEAVMRARKGLGEEAFHNRCRHLSGNDDGAFRNNVICLARTATEESMEALGSVLSSFRESSPQFLEKTAIQLASRLLRLFTDNPQALSVFVKNLGAPAMAAAGMIAKPGGEMVEIGRPDSSCLMNMAGRMGGVFNEACRYDNHEALRACILSYATGSHPVFTALMDSKVPSPEWHGWLCHDIDKKSPGVDHSKRLSTIRRKWALLGVSDSTLADLEGRLARAIASPAVSEPEKLATVRTSFRVDMPFAAILLGAGEKCLTVVSEAFPGDIPSLFIKCKAARSLPGKASDVNERISSFMSKPWAVATMERLHMEAFLDPSMDDDAQAPPKRAPGI